MTALASGSFSAKKFLDLGKLKCYDWLAKII